MSHGGVPSVGLGNCSVMHGGSRVSKEYQIISILLLSYPQWKNPLGYTNETINSDCTRVTPMISLSPMPTLVHPVIDKLRKAWG